MEFVNAMRDGLALIVHNHYVKDPVPTGKDFVILMLTVTAFQDTLEIYVKFPLPLQISYLNHL